MYRVPVAVTLTILSYPLGVTIFSKLPIVPIRADRSVHAVPTVVGRRRIASKAMTAAETEILRLSTFPAIGI